MNRSGFFGGDFSINRPTMIEMLDDLGNVTEVCEATKNERADETAVCEDGENTGARSLCDGPVYQWTTADGMTFQACRYHIEHDDFSRFA